MQLVNTILSESPNTPIKVEVYKDKDLFFIKCYISGAHSTTKNDYLNRGIAEAAARQWISSVKVLHG